MNKANLILFVLILFIASCDRKEKKMRYYKTFVKIEEESLTPEEGLIEKPIIGTVITAYQNESDFWSEKNPFMEGQTDYRGELLIYFGGTEKHFWIKAKKGKLNNLRFKKFLTSDQESFGGYSGGESCPTSASCTSAVMPHFILSTTPTRLQLRIFDNGVPVNGAKVKVYLKESDYINNIIPDTGDYIKYKVDSSYRTPRLPEYYDVLQKKTGVNGEVLFERFETRKYWFRVTKDGKSNASTTFSTDGPLPDDPNVTTVLDIGIK